MIRLNVILRMWMLILSMFVCYMPYQMKAVSVTYGITVCNEAEELKRLLKQLSDNLDDEDIIIVQTDRSNTTKEVEKVIKKFKKIFSSSQFYVIKKSLNENFAGFKNNLLKYAGKEESDFLFLLDADEYLSDALMRNLKWYLSINKDVECFRMARANYYVNLEEDPEYKQAIAGGLDDMGRFLYMDEKTRIINLKNQNIRYEGKVHEEITGCQKTLMLPYDKGNCWEIIHIKTPKKQRKQNELYAKISRN